MDNISTGCRKLSRERNESACEYNKPTSRIMAEDKKKSNTEISV